MTITPLVRNIAIGVAAAAVVAAGIAGAWWTAAKPDDSLAARLPAEAVLAYASLPADGGAAQRAMMELAPRLPAFPAGMDEERAVEAAAVRGRDGTEGWITQYVSADGRRHIQGSDPALQSLLADESPSLASDSTFRALQWTDGSSWAYLAFPSLSSDGSPAASVLALERPVAVRIEGGLVLRQATDPTPHLPAWSGQPLVTVPDADVTLLLPPWNALAELGTLLTDDARTVAETLATSFLDGVAGGLSLRYDVSALLHGPSLFRSGGDGAFALEGDGVSAAETDRVLRAMHAKFASARGSATVRDVSAEGFVIRTMTQGDDGKTTERTDGSWTILETNAGDAVLTSARDGSRFAVTTVPGGIANGNAAPLITSSNIRWSETAEARVRPVSPTLMDGGASVEFLLREGPGYVEWTRIGVTSL